MIQKQLLLSVTFAALSASAFSQKIEVKKDVIYSDDVAIAAIPHKKRQFSVVSPKGDSLFTITLVKTPIYYYEYDFQGINKTVKSVDFYTPGSSKSDSFMTRYQEDKGLYPVIKSETNYIAKKIMEAGLIKNGALDAEAVEQFSKRNPNEIVDKQLAAKAGEAAASKEEEKKEAATLAAVAPSVDDQGVIKSGANVVIGRITLKDVGRGEMDVSVYNQAGQLVASGATTSVGNNFSTGSDQKQHKIPTLSYADFSSGKDFMRTQDGFLLVAKYFVKKSYLK